MPVLSRSLRRPASRLTFTGSLLLLATPTSALFLILRVATHGPWLPWLVSGVLASSSGICSADSSCPCGSVPATRAGVDLARGPGAPHRVRVRK